MHDNWSLSSLTSRQRAPGRRYKS